jgi:hypothetical protein
MADEHWKDEPEAQDFPAAQSYLTLLVGLDSATKLRKALKKQQSLSHFAAKDILRAAGLTLLAADDPEVAADLEKGQVRHQALPGASRLWRPVVDRRWVSPGVRQLSPQ